MSPALPCNFGLDRKFLPRGSASTFFVHKDGHSCAQVRESRLLIPPSHFEVPSMLSNRKLVCAGAIERKSRAGKANDVRIDLSADVAQSVRPARAQRTASHNLREHA